MTTENLLFPREHMVIRDGYFYYFDERNNTLNKRVNDGKTAFVYPTEIPLGSKPVESLEYDGMFFWSLQEGITSEDIVIKKWAINNYICKLEDTIDLQHSSEYKFDCPTMSLEYYDTELLYALPAHSSELTLQSFYSKVTPGTKLTLGPNSLNQYEDVTVTGTLSTPDSFGLDFYTKYSYESDAIVNFSKSIWLVNHFLFASPGGSLCRIDLTNDNALQVIPQPDAEYVNASCFYNTLDTQYILFILGTAARFFNIESLVVEKSMFIDNIKTDQATVIPIYDIKVVDGTLFRLQQAATYFGNDYSFSTFNIQCSPIRPFIDSITIDINPTILPSNGVNVAEIISFLKDQYSDPLKSKPITFSEDDPTGFVTIANTYTSLQGKAISYYKAGLVPNTVNITVLATQYD